jgi:hypothetical protein
MAQAVARWPVVVKSHLRYEGTPYEIIGGNMAPRQIFSEYV